MPTSCKLEPRPRHPVVFSQWVRQAENAITVFGLVYGRMREPERRRALETSRLVYEEDDVAFPADYMY
eukprot:5019242-Pyramimonas_sp.AAC.1